MKKPIIVTLILCLAGISWFALAREAGFNGPEKAKALDEATLSLVEDDPNAPEASDEDRKILAELSQLFATIGGEKPFYMEGELTVADPADSSQRAAGSGKFYYYKNGQQVWFKNSEQEMVNSNDHYAVADHQLKRIIAGPARQIEEAAMVPLPSIGKNLKAEGYAIEKTEVEGKVVIRLLSETHISCKEIRVEYDAQSKRPSLLFYRFTDLDHPDEVSFDKTMSISLSKWETGDAAHHKLPAVITVAGNTIRAATGFEGYEIIDLVNK